MKLLCAQAFRRALVRQLFQAALTVIAFLAALYFSGGAPSNDALLHNIFGCSPAL